MLRLEELTVASGGVPPRALFGLETPLTSIRASAMRSIWSQNKRPSSIPRPLPVYHKKQSVRIKRPNASLDVPQRSGGVGEVGCIQHLYARIMLTVKRSHGGWAAGFLGIGRTVEPQPKMIHLDWISWWI